MNGQPTGFAGWINRMQMASFSAFTGELRTTLVLLVLTGVDVWLLTQRATEILYSRALEPLTASASVSVFLAHNTAAEQMRQVGLYLAVVIIGAVLGKSVTSLLGQKNVRETSREYVEAKAKGEAAGTPAVAVSAKDQAKVEVTAPVNGVVTAGSRDEREPSVFHDDERGE